MLKHLSIQNYALIDDVQIRFDEGFSVITGETGSGKSILLGALGLITGKRADTKVLRDTSTKCIVEGTVSLSKKEQPFFEENNLDFDSETILRREISPSGKSRAFINDTPVTLDVLSNLTTKLFDIHSQHQTQLLKTKEFVWQIIDAGCNTFKEFEKYSFAYKEFVAKQKELEQKEEELNELLKEKDYNEFQLNALKEIKLEEVDEEEITSELNLLENAGDLKNNAENISELISNENGIIDRLYEAEQLFEKLTPIDPFFGELTERIRSARIEIDDVDQTLNQKVDDIQLDGDRLLELQELMNRLFALQKKFHVTTVQELIELKNELEDKVYSFDVHVKEIDQLKAEVENDRNDLKKQANQLKDKRNAQLPLLRDLLNKSLHQLHMQNSEIKFEQSDLDDLDRFGSTSMLVMFTANAGSNFQPMHQIASGGELSRIMLSLKSIVAQKMSLPTVVFDEIDTGTSGEVANSIGDKMIELTSSNSNQVFCITHLPQIAAKGKVHYKVYKEVVDGVTYTRIKELNKDERLVEIAGMLSGNNPSQAAIDNARELMN